MPINFSIAPKLLILIFPIITAICLFTRPSSASSKSEAVAVITQSASPDNPLLPYKLHRQRIP